MSPDNSDAGNVLLGGESVLVGGVLDAFDVTGPPFRVAGFFVVTAGASVDHFTHDVSDRVPQVTELDPVDVLDQAEQVGGSGCSPSANSVDGVSAHSAHCPGGRS